MYLRILSITITITELISPGFTVNRYWIDHGYVPTAMRNQLITHTTEFNEFGSVCNKMGDYCYVSKMIYFCYFCYFYININIIVICILIVEYI